MKKNTQVNRRGFLGAGLLAGSSVASWLTGCGGQKNLRKAGKRQPLDARFTYDIKAFEHTDPKLLLYTETAQIPTDFQEPKRITAGSNGTFWIGGDQAVKRLGADGKRHSTLTLAATPQALTVAEQDRLFVALKDHFEIYDTAGKLLQKSESLGPKTYLTGIAVAGDVIFLADAGNREVIRCDMTGKVIGRFGRLGGKDGTPGFLIPSPYFHLLIGGDGLLWVNNSGRHAVEAYTLDGKYEFSWGQPGMSIENFCGCCNPVYFTRLLDGRFVTSEKGLNRIKIYDQKGQFVGVVAGPEQLVKDREQAAKACANCNIGFGFDVACDSQGRVLALDPASRTIRIFSPQAT
ncbi:MAG: hypothetical protein EPN23_09830 [Verrucomicrobia bacterium]|nr:MAG: hypothetical protein EPN23_09830 [Verrucomicrobiota bacterium]